MNHLLPTSIGSKKRISPERRPRLAGIVVLVIGLFILMIGDSYAHAQIGELKEVITIIEIIFMVFLLSLSLHLSMKPGQFTTKRRKEDKHAKDRRRTRDRSTGAPRYKK